VLILSRSILQFSGSTNIGAIRIIWKLKQRKPPDKDILTPSANLRSLRFGAESIWDLHFVIRRDISKSNLKSLRLGEESIIANQNNQQALSVSTGVGIPSQALSVTTSVGTSLTTHHANAAVYLSLPCGFLGNQFTSCGFLDDHHFPCGFLGYLSQSCGFLDNLTIPCGFLGYQILSCGFLDNLTIPCGFLGYQIPTCGFLVDPNLPCGFLGNQHLTFSNQTKSDFARCVVVE
jgi:hypothetical protein